MKTPIPGGFLVVVEGIDGSGKSTVASQLAQYCGERGLGACYSKEPTGVGAGQRLRQSMLEGRLTLEEEIALFAEDRREHVERAIAPALAQNYIVILDRYYWSTAAYQGARGAEVETILKQNRAFAPEPDLVLLFDLPAETARQRIHGRGDQPNAFEETAYQSRVRDIFLSVLAGSTGGEKLDATRPQREVWKEALHRFLQKAEQKIHVGVTDPSDRTRAMNELLG